LRILNLGAVIYHRKVWFGDGDGVHGESMAVFSSGRMDAVGFMEEEYAGHSARYSSIVKQIDNRMDPATGVLDKDVAELAGPLFALQHGIFRSALEMHLGSMPEIGVYLPSSVPATDYLISCRYPHEFVLHCRQVVLLHKCKDLLISACAKLNCENVRVDVHTAKVALSICHCLMLSCRHWLFIKASLLPGGDDSY
jgi:hypothetical protein